MPSKRVFFENDADVRLAGILELPEKPRAFALFCHCFTCSKDLKAIVRISRRMSQHGIAVLRFDFTGLGNSQGDFSQSTFQNNLVDVRAAIRFLESNYEPPSLFVGHSLGGAALMHTCPSNEEVKAISTIASPSSTHHLADYLTNVSPEIETRGEGEVVIGGRPWRLRKALIDDLRNTDLESRIRQIQIPHLIMHPPEDQTLPFWHAEKLFEMSSGPRSFVTLDGADHLLVNHPVDVNFVGDTIAGWFQRIIERATADGA